MVSSELWGAAMVPSNILTRVFSLRYGDQQATGFTIEVEGRQYLITARHLLLPAPSEGVIEIFHDSNWVKLSFRSIQVEPSTIDIAVLALPQQISSLLPIELGFKETFLSQAIFFVGFPFGLSIDGNTVNRGFPIPLVKHGIISSFGGTNEPFLIDGINNPGFSGGPIVRVDNKPNPTIIGVVSAYKASQEAVYQGKSKTDLTIQANTGLLVAFAIDYAIDAIKKNPIGFIIRPHS